MLKPVEGIQIMAHLSGQPLSWTENNARALREANQDLWPQVGRGSRGGVISVQHASNLLIATMAPDASPSEAVHTVLDFRTLKLPARSASVETSPVPSLAADLFSDIATNADSFSGFLVDLLTRLIADIEAGASSVGLGAFLAAHRFEVAMQFQPTQPPLVTVLLDRAGLLRFAYEGHPLTRHESGDGVLWWYATTQQRLRKTSWVPWGVFISLAAAFAHSRVDFAFLPPDALAAALAPPKLVSQSVENEP
jgi:hypothetical protein